MLIAPTKRYKKLEASPYHHSLQSNNSKITIIIDSPANIISQAENDSKNVALSSNTSPSTLKKSEYKENNSTHKSETIEVTRENEIEEISNKDICIDPNVNMLNNVTNQNINEMLVSKSVLSNENSVMNTEIANVNKVIDNKVLDCKIDKNNVNNDKVVGSVLEISNKIDNMLNGDGISNYSTSFLEDSSSENSSKTLIKGNEPMLSESVSTYSNVSAKQQIMELFLNSQNMTDISTDGQSETSICTGSTLQNSTDNENSDNESSITLESENSDFNESTYSKYLNKVCSKDYEKSKKTFKNMDYLNTIGNIVIDQASNNEESENSDIFTLHEGEVHLDVLGEHPQGPIQQQQHNTGEPLYSEIEKGYGDMDKHNKIENSDFSDTSWDVYSKYDILQSQYNEQITIEEKVLKIIQYLLDFPSNNKTIFCIILLLILMLIGFAFAPWVFCLIFLMNKILIQGKDTIVGMKLSGGTIMEENISHKIKNEVQLKILNGDISVTDRILIPFKIKSNKVIAELDSGAAVNVLSESIILAVNPNYKNERKAKKYRLSTVDGSQIPTIGAYYIPCDFSGIGVINIPFHIIKTEKVSLLGRPFLVQTNLVMKVTGNKIKISLHPRRNKVYSPPFIKNIDKIDLIPGQKSKTIFNVKNLKALQQETERIIPFQTNNPNVVIEYKVYNLNKERNKIGLIITNVGHQPLHLEAGGLVALVLPYIPEKDKEINITGFRNSKLKPIKAVEIIDFQSSCKIICDTFISAFSSGMEGQLSWKNFKETAKYFIRNVTGNFIINNPKNEYRPCPMRTYR